MKRLQTWNKATEHATENKALAKRSPQMQTKDQTDSPKCARLYVSYCSLAHFFFYAVFECTLGLAVAKCWGRHLDFTPRRQFLSGARVAPSAADCEANDWYDHNKPFSEIAGLGGSSMKMQEHIFIRAQAIFQQKKLEPAGFIEPQCLNGCSSKLLVCL